MTEKLKKPLKACLFSVILLLCMLLLNSFFQPVWFSVNNYYTVKGFYEDPKNRIEAIFLGSSVVSSGILPQEIYEEYGICSYNLASVSQPVDASYYWAEEAWRLHSDTLKTVIFDVSELRTTGEDSFTHRAIDHMKLSPVKVKAALDYTDNDISEAVNYLFTLNAYHSRWTELTESDFTKFSLDPVNGTRGNDFMLSMYTVRKEFGSVYMKGTVIDPNAEKKELKEESVDTFRKLVSFCEEKGLKLVLIKTPTNNWSSALHNAIDEVADEYGLEFYDFNFEPYYSDIGVLYGFDMQEGYHLNYYGATKLSRWLGEYLVNECGATDVRNDPDYEYMKKQLSLYKETVEIKARLSETRDICSYLETASVDGNTVFITANSDITKKLTDEQRSAFREMGLEKLSVVKENDYYIAVIENGVVTEEMTGEKGTDNLILEGVLTDKTQYVLTSGTDSDGNPLASCIIDKDEKAKNTQGINVTVYNTNNKKYVTSEVFDTSAESDRDTYSLDYLSLIKDESSLEKYADDKVFTYIVEYEKKLSAKNAALKEDYAKKNNDIFYYIDKYRTDDTVIIISAQDDAATSLSDKVREKFTAYGFKELSLLQFREAYIAVMDGDTMVYEERKGSEEAILYEDGIFRIESAGFSAGNIASVKIKGEEYSERLRGLNLVIYDKSEDSVIFTAHFDTYSSPIYTTD